MVNLGQRNGASTSRVAAAQSLRVVAVVLCIPALFKLLLGDGPALHTSAPVDWAWLAVLVPAGGLVALLWQRLRQPNPWLFGPCWSVPAPASPGTCTSACPQGPARWASC